MSIKLYIISKLIMELEPGLYESSEIYGEYWGNVQSPRSEGREFKKMVENDKFKRISIKGYRSNNHVEYEVA